MTLRDNPVKKVTDINLTWNEEERMVGELHDNSHNPRRIKKSEFEKLVNLVKDLGYRTRITIDTENMILGGHQRKKALLEAGFVPSSVIKVIVPSRKLTEQEKNAVIISDNGIFGEFDLEILANEFEIGDLFEWGIPDGIFGHLETEEKKEGSQKEPKEIICPECGHHFVKG